MGRRVLWTYVDEHMLALEVWLEGRRRFERHRRTARLGDEDWHALRATLSIEAARRKLDFQRAFGRRHLLPCLLPGVETASHFVRQLLERVCDRQLLHRVPRFRVCGERLPQLLRPTESPAQREVLSEWVAFLVLLPHEKATEIGVSHEADAEHVVALPLEPIRT